MSKKIVILDTYVKKLNPPDESTRPSRRVLFNKEYARDELKRLARIRRLAEDIHRKTRAAGLTEEQLIQDVNIALKEYYAERRSNREQQKNDE